MPKINPTECFLGVDPGKNGGVAILPCFSVWRMPETETDICNLFTLIANEFSPKFALIEWIHPAIQGVGKSSMSKLYGNYMQLRMCLVQNKIPFEDIKPKKWQSEIRVEPRKKSMTTTQWKDCLRGKAQLLFPDLPDWDNTLSHQRAICDALLIAEVAQRLKGKV